MKERYDPTDIEILSELRSNCKQSIRVLANKLGVHPNTLMQRIKKLENGGVIRQYCAEIDYSKLGYDITAVVMVKIMKRGLENIDLMRSVVAIPEVEAAYAITGTSDVIIMLRVKNSRHMTEILKRIQMQSNILRTNTHLVLYTYKHDYEFNPLKASDGQK